MSEPNSYCEMCEDDEDYPDCKCVSLQQVLAQLDHDAERRIEASKELEAMRTIVDDLRQRTIAQQQARIEALTQTYVGRDGESVTAAEMIDQLTRFGREMEKMAIENSEALAAERERAEELEQDNTRLEALAGLATSTAEEFRARGRKVYDSQRSAWTEDKALAFALTGWEWDWLQRFDVLITQAPEADHVGGLMSIPAYQQREAPEAGR